MHNLIGEIFSGVWLIDPQKASGYLPIIANLLKGESNSLIQNLSEKREDGRASLYSTATGYRISEYGQSDPPEKAPQNSVVVIPINGPITKYDQFCGPSGTKTKSDLLQRADANPNIVAAILEIDSGGGEGAGTQHFAEIIKNTNMPVIALVEDMAASAAYWIASACDMIIMQEQTSQVGSIGAYTTLIDVKRYFKNAGLDLMEVYAKQSTEKNKAFREAFNNDDTSYIKDKITEFNQFFIDDVKTNRAHKIKAGSDPFKGQTYFANDAVEIGLADAIGNLSFAINQAKKLSENYKSKTNPDMKINETWTAIKSFLGMDTTELKEEDVTKINTELQQKTTELTTVAQERDQLKTDLENEKLARTTAENSLKAEQDKVAALTIEKADLEQKLAQKPAASTTAVDGNDKQVDTDKNDVPVDEADEVVKSFTKH